MIVVGAMEVVDVVGTVGVTRTVVMTFITPGIPLAIKLQCVN